MLCRWQKHCHQTKELVSCIQWPTSNRYFDDRSLYENFNNLSVDCLKSLFSGESNRAVARRSSASLRSATPDGPLLSRASFKQLYRWQLILKDSHLLNKVWEKCAPFQSVWKVDHSIKNTVKNKSSSSSNNACMKLCVTLHTAIVDATSSGHKKWSSILHCTQSSGDFSLAISSIGSKSYTCDRNDKHKTINRK